MGSSQSTHSPSTTADENDEDEDEADDDNNNHPPTLTPTTIGPHHHHPSNSKILPEQEPEILPCRSSASPLSAVGTPRCTGPHIRVWDPCHVLLPPPPSSSSSSAFYADVDPVNSTTEVFLIAHGESAASLRPDLVSGRWAAARLTGNGERQARALAVFLKSQGVRFRRVYSSPLDRAMATAAFVCRELGFASDQIEPSDSLVEMSQGQWEGCLRSETYTPEILTIIDKTLPDFSPPSGESLRQVEFRMIEFLNRTVLQIPEKLITSDSTTTLNDLNRSFSRQSSTNSVQEKDNGPHWDLVYRLNRPGLQKKKSGKSRLQFVTTGDNETEDELLNEPSSRNLTSTTCIGIFTHSTPIKCLLAGIVGASPAASQMFCVDDSSVTVIQHSLRSGWQIKRLNDTSHLRLL